MLWHYPCSRCARGVVLTLRIRNLKLGVTLLCFFMAALPVCAQQAAPFPHRSSKEDRYSYLLPYILEAANNNGVDPYLLTTVCDLETTFQPGLTSYKGARGLTQLMPATAARFGVTNAYDFRQALDGGAKYLRYLTQYFDGNLDLILAGYNAGEGNVIKYGRRVPPFNETQSYVARGRVLYLRYLQAKFPDLNLALKAGGVRPTSYVQTTAAPSQLPAQAVVDAPQLEPLPPTRSIVYGESVKASDNENDTKETSPAPARATRSIKFQ